jgi:hypothetical protein
LGPPESLFGSNVEATPEDGEPDHAGNSHDNSVWYELTPPSSGSYVIDTFGSLEQNESIIDTIVGVYQGPSVDALTPITSNDDWIGYDSCVVLDATAFESYFIAVDGYNQRQGNFVITLDEGATCRSRPLPRR